MTELRENLDRIEQEKIEKIIPENIKKGVNIFNVEGSLDGGIKQFSNIEEMNQSTENKEGDLAIVYGITTSKLTATAEFSKATLPDIVVLPEAVTDYIRIEFQAVDPSQRIDCYGNLNEQELYCDFMTHNHETDYTINYTSTDGITYTKQEGTPDEITFDFPIKYGSPWGGIEEWNDVLGYFFQVQIYNYDGLFKYNLNIIDKTKFYFIDISSVSFNYSGRITSLICTKLLDKQYSLEYFNKLRDLISDQFNKLEVYITFYINSNNELCFLIVDMGNDNGDLSICIYTDTKNFLGIGSNNGIYENKTVTSYKVNSDNTFTKLKDYICRVDSMSCTYINLTDIISVPISLGFSSQNINTGLHITVANHNMSDIYNGLNQYLIHDIYLPAPTQLNARAMNVWKDTFYGANGVENGILNKTDNLDKDTLINKCEIYSNLVDNEIICPKIMDWMFDEYKGTKILLLNTSNTLSMRGTFANCRNLTTIPKIDTSKVTNMCQMFWDAYSITTIPQLDTSNVIDMDDMFSGCSNLIEVPLLDTSKVTDISLMFRYCNKLIKIPQFDTSNVIRMQYTFDSCSNLTTIPLLNTSSLIDMVSAFEDCPNLSDESLNNILQMCVNSKISDYKTLYHIGLSQEQSTKCQSLSNWSAFTSAGWSSGY